MRARFGHRASAWHSGRVLAIVCPGQGSQSVGMLTPWLELAGVSMPTDWEPLSLIHI